MPGEQPSLPSKCLLPRTKSRVPLILSALQPQIVRKGTERSRYDRGSSLGYLFGILTTPLARIRPPRTLSRDQRSPKLTSGVRLIATTLALQHQHHFFHPSPRTWRPII